MSAIKQFDEVQYRHFLYRAKNGSVREWEKSEEFAPRVGRVTRKVRLSNGRLETDDTDPESAGYGGDIYVETSYLRAYWVQPYGFHRAPFLVADEDVELVDEGESK